MGSAQGPERVLSLFEIRVDLLAARQLLTGSIHGDSYSRSAKLDPAAAGLRQLLMQHRTKISDADSGRITEELKVRGLFDKVGIVIAQLENDDAHNRDDCVAFLTAILEITKGMKGA